MVEIAKALSVDARVLIMDEPTPSLSQRRLRVSSKVIGQLRERARALSTFRIGSAKSPGLADRVTVLRDGANAGELARQEITHDAMVQLMVGRDIEQLQRAANPQIGCGGLEASGLRSPAFPDHRLDFSVRAGEIVGRARDWSVPVVPNCCRRFFGITPALEGQLKMGEVPLLPREPRGQEISVRGWPWFPRTESNGGW
ncbi:MAG: hypothetical protein Ct9H300mP1_23540 [Planctomycetaceae bacterium]|nr:MAG: hypothetical protein Ct9H300mP1_23540 [Planctomycetaceae bacterium]